jgi:hypothetical protein
MPALLVHGKHHEAHMPCSLTLISDAHWFDQRQLGHRRLPQCSCSSKSSKREDSNKNHGTASWDSRWHRTAAAARPSHAAGTCSARSRWCRTHWTGSENTRWAGSFCSMVLHAMRTQLSRCGGGAASPQLVLSSNVPAITLRRAC